VYLKDKSRGKEEGGGGKRERGEMGDAMKMVGLWKRWEMVEVEGSEKTVGEGGRANGFVKVKGGSGLLGKRGRIE